MFGISFLSYNNLFLIFSKLSVMLFEVFNTIALDLGMNPTRIEYLSDSTFMWKLSDRRFMQLHYIRLSLYFISSRLRQNYLTEHYLFLQRPNPDLRNRCQMPKPNWVLALRPLFLRNHFVYNVAPLGHRSDDEDRLITTISRFFCHCGKNSHRKISGQRSVGQENSYL
jgi:hypothetical protein